ncbi:MAG: pilus assembly protein CpaE [Anaerolineae bacterium]
MQLALKTAQKLKTAGIDWEPKTHDFFAMPDVDMDDRVFALSDMTISMEVLHGYHAITFVGSVEWALDFVYHSDAVWLPTESQLREMIVSRLEEGSTMTLQTSIGGYVITIDTGSSRSLFEGVTAIEAYAAALLGML